MKVQFANGKVYTAQDVDEAIHQCLAAGDDPFNPVVLEEQIKQEKKQKNADTISE